MASFSVFCPLLRSHLIFLHRAELLAAFQAFAVAFAAHDSKTTIEPLEPPLANPGASSHTANALPPPLPITIDACEGSVGLLLDTAIVHASGGGGGAAEVKKASSGEYIDRAGFVRTLIKVGG